ncbi:MAG: DNA polymerase IV [Proteobacteria bacterium]|nr:DNA polymerase IV [Pseudomonadota bacterium]MBU1058400.1 DNA polymerase IV [Pseudomonadota bacterium]
MRDQRYILHIDMDAFFASVEQLDNPKLAGRPLIVGGNPKSRGVVAACSYEARRYGIHSAMAGAKAFRLCPQAIFVRPRIERYHEISTHIMEIFRRSTALVEPLSLDEAFLDISADHHSFAAAAQTAESIRSQIFQETGLTGSAGVSYNKFLAKTASDINKPDGLTVISHKEAKSFIASLAIGKFYGVGKVTEQKMHTLGIRTGQDLLRFSKKELLVLFGKAGAYFHDIARGIDTRPVQRKRTRKSMGTETTLQTDILDLDLIRQIVEDLAQKVAQGLRSKGMGGHTITLKVRYHDFTTVTRSLSLSSPLYDAREILHHTPHLLRSTEAGKRRIRLLGITISNLTTCQRKNLSSCISLLRKKQQSISTEEQTQPEMIITLSTLQREKTVYFYI